MKDENIQDIPIQKLVQDYTQYYLKIWLASDDNIPCLGSTYSEQEQLSRENNLNQLIHTLNTECSRQSPHSKNDCASENTFSTTFKTFLETLFDFKNEHLDCILSKDFKKATNQFIKYARSFDHTITPEDLKNGLSTVFSRTYLHDVLDACTNRTFQFGNAVMDQMNRCSLSSYHRFMLQALHDFRISDNYNTINQSI
jgi:hypothetical protein